jgi:hypothetical protein
MVIYAYSDLKALRKNSFTLLIKHFKELVYVTSIKKQLLALTIVLIVALILQLFYPIAGNILLSLGIIGVILIYLLQSRKQDHSKILAEFIKEGDLQDQNKKNLEPMNNHHLS